MKKVILLTTLLAAVHAHAAISFFDPFADATASGGTSYTAGSSLAVGTVPAQTNAFGVPWFCLSNTFPNNLGVPTITNDNLTYGGLGASSGNAVYIPPQPGNMGRVALSAPVTTGKVYYSFMLKVTDVSTLTTATTTNFFAGFTDTTGNAKTFVLRSTSYLVAKKSGAGYLLGIGKRNIATANVVYDTTVYNVGDVLYVVAGYDYDTVNHPASLWINPTGLGGTTPPAATLSTTTGTDLNAPGIAGFVLGGYTNAAPPGCVVDDVRISTNWAVVTGAPEIETQPIASQSKNAGDSTSITSLAMGGAPLTYQWQRNGVNVSNDGNISGATAAVLSIASVSQATAGTYNVVVTDPVGSVTSSSSVLNVTDPYISSQPSSLSLSPGDNATFSITATGAAPLSFQWYKGASLLSNGANISGATTSTLTISGVSVADVGSYSCYVTNSLGGVLQSSSANLSVTDPAITAQPQSVTGNYGTAATFSVTAVGSAPITYQWRLGGNSLSNGANISGAQSGTLTVSGISYLDNGSYSVVVTSPGGTATSSDASLSVVEPIITGQPVAETVAAGNNANFSVTVSGAAPITYQWKKNGANVTDGGNVSGSQSSALTLSAVTATDAASYSVSVADASGTNVLSSSALLTVLNPPSITAQPQSRRIVAGNKAVFAVSASGAATLAYQWLLNGSAISGATGASLSIPNAQASDDGSYSVVVTNSVGAATSSAAVLDVVASVRLYNTNLVVLRAGDGAQTQTLNGNSVFLDQFDQSGNYVNTVSIPDSGASALIEQGLDQNSSTLTGSALSHSGNNRFLVLAGYNASAPYSSALQSTTAAAVPRAIGTVDTYGNYSLAVADTNAYSGTYFRGAAYDGVHNFWGAGNAGGTYYFGLDAAAATIQNTFANLRSVDIFNGNLYTVSGAGSGTGILKWNGQPTAATAATTLFVPPAVSSDIAVDSTGTNIYVGTSAGVEKWQFDGTTWTMPYTLSIGAVRYIAVDFSGVAPVIYATTTDATFNRILTVTDTGASATATTFATAGLNQTFRGLRFGPSETPAAVVSSPSSQTGATGGSVVLSGTVTGDAPLSIQWSKDSTLLVDGVTGSGSVISGSTTASLTIANLSVTDQGNYSFTVTNAHSSATSSSASLTVMDGPTITSAPAATTVNYGDNAVFNVAANGGGTLTYQWKKGAANLSNIGNISGATSASLTVSGVAAGDVDSYTVVVSNEAGNTSASATLAVNDPIITTQPVAQTSECNGSVVFTASASGSGSLAYQWTENGAPLSDGGNVSGSATAALTLNGLSGSQSGNSYALVVSGAQTLTSSAATLTVVDTAPPVVTLNGAASMTVSCHDAFSDPGATANDSCSGSLAVTPSGSVDVNASGNYTLTYTATDAGNNSGSAIRVVTVTGCAPTISTQPQSQTINAGTTLNLSVVASASSPTYQWYKNDATIDGATDATYAKPNALRADAGSYYVVITASAATVTSETAVIVVNDPVINVQPTSKTGSAGSNVVLAVQAGGTQLSYHWYQVIGTATKKLVDSAATGVSGATTASLTLSKLTAVKNGGSYYCVITNAPNGHLQTDSVTVTVYDPPKLTMKSSHGPKVKRGFDNTLSVKLSKGALAPSGPPVNYQWYHDGNLIAGATDSSYSTPNAQPGYEGLYRCDVQNNAPDIGSASLAITLVDDTKAPSSVLITDPKANTKATNSLALTTQTNVAPDVYFSGKVVENGLLVNVNLIRTNPANALLNVPAAFVTSDLHTATNPVAGKRSQWAVLVQLVDGTNTFYAEATDSAGLKNTSKAFNCYYMANPETFHVVTEKVGGGAPKSGVVTGILSNMGKPAEGTLLDIGQPYTIKAAPTTTFVKWTDGINDLSTSPTYQFTMTPGLTLHAVYSK